MADLMEPCKLLWGRPLLSWQRNFGKFGLFLHKIAYNSACMADVPEMFGPTGGGVTRRPTLVAMAMATTFGLGAESTLVAYRLVIKCVGLRCDSDFTGSPEERRDRSEESFAESGRRIIDSGMSQTTH